MSEINNQNTKVVDTPIGQVAVPAAPGNNEEFNALATVNALNEAMNGECQGLEFSLDKLSIPSGGGTSFLLPSIDSEEPVETKEIEGIIVYNLPAYSYYKDKFNGQNNPPDCYSIDGVHGCGTPGGNCKSCPFNVFGSGENNSKACKNKRMLYILMKGQMFPLVLYLPTGSIKAFTNYMKGTLSRGMKVSQVVTKITLKRVQNSTGIAYSQAVFTFVRALGGDEIKNLAPLNEFIMHYSQSRAPQIATAPDDEVPFGTDEKNNKAADNGEPF